MKSAYERCGAKFLMKFSALPAIDVDEREPVLNFCERASDQAAWTAGTIHAAGDNPSFFRHLEVVRYCRLTHRKRLSNLPGSGLAVGPARDDGATGRVGEGCKCEVKDHGFQI